MQMPVTKSQERKKKARAITAHHEAGHAVAAHVLRLPVKSVSIVPEEGSAVPEEGSAGRVLYGDTRGRIAVDGLLHGASFDGLTRVSKELIVLLAGMEAQRRFCPQSCRRYHASKDYEMAEGYCVRFCGGDYQEAEFFRRWLRKRAENLVTGIWWPYIQSLADELVEREEMTGREVTSLLEARVKLEVNSAPTQPTGKEKEPAVPAPPFSRRQLPKPSLRRSR